MNNENCFNPKFPDFCPNEYDHHEHEREHGENPANTAEPHHRTNKGELNHD